jgi:hypothetical protein
MASSSFGIARFRLSPLFHFAFFHLASNGETGTLFLRFPTRPPRKTTGSRPPIQSTPACFWVGLGPLTAGYSGWTRTRLGTVEILRG